MNSSYSPFTSSHLSDPAGCPTSSRPATRLQGGIQPDARGLGTHELSPGAVESCGRIVERALAARPRLLHTPRPAVRLRPQPDRQTALSPLEGMRGAPGSRCHAAGSGNATLAGLSDD